MDTLTKLIESFATRDKVALKFKNDFREFTWTYKELYIAIKKTAAYLSAQSIKPGDKILLWGPNSPQWVVSYFAIIALGAIVVPLDLKTIREQAKKIYISAGAKLTIKTKFKPGFNNNTIYLEDLFHSIDRHQAISVLGTAKKNDLAELIYTSGTTGDPKGVMISHYNLMSNVKAVVKRISVKENDELLSVLPLSHLFEQTAGMLAPLAAGASIVYLNTIKPSAIFKSLKNEKITIFLCVPRLLYGFRTGLKQKFSSPAKKRLFSLLSALAKNKTQHAKKRIFFLVHSKFNKHFRFFVSGGSYLDPSTESFWEKMGFKIIQGYGLSECSPILAVNSEANWRLSSVGRPLDNVKMKLAHDGEILAKGPNIFSGYFNEPQKTQTAFRDGWFLTGDIGKIDQHGNYYIKSRKKDMIVTPSGINVYPEEIESILNETPGIKESAVLGFPEENGELVTAVIIPDHAGADINGAIEEANKELDSSQQIMNIHIWPETEFPKTTTLKIKKTLVKKYFLKPGGKEKKTKKYPPLIKLLAGISPLPIDKIRNSHKIYSDLKIDSIGRVELVSRIEQEFTLDFEEELIAETTTVADLQVLIERRAAEQKKVSFPHWTFVPLLRRLRRYIMGAVGLKIIAFWCRTDAQGLKNLKSIKTPVIFAANHLSYFDQGAIMAALPPDWRGQIATAAWEEYFCPPKTKFFTWLYKRLAYYYCVLFWGIFPLSQTANFKKTLEFTGSLVDKNLHILIFPEGERSRNGRLLPFKKGLSLLAQNLSVPIVPIKITGTDKVLHRDRRWPRAGQVRVNFGQAIYFTNQSQDEILSQVTNKIKSLP